MIVRLLTAGVAIAGLFTLAGCGGDSSPSTRKPAGAERERSSDPAAAAQLSKLPAADKSIAEAQKVCPISGDLLGSMGVPRKLTLKGETVFVCCKSCVDDAQAHPDETLKAVKKADGK